MNPAVDYWFYHLTHSGIDAVLPDILEKTFAKGWTAEVRIGGGSENPLRELTRLDSYLWAYKKASFLPHGRADEPGAQAHPIILSSGDTAIKERNIACLLYGAQLPTLESVDRCITMFIDSNADEKMTARTRWKAAKDAGAKTSYWAQDEYGKWIQPVK